MKDDGAPRIGDCDSCDYWLTCRRYKTYLKKFAGCPASVQRQFTNDMSDFIRKEFKNNRK